MKGDRILPRASYLSVWDFLYKPHGFPGKSATILKLMAIRAFPDTYSFGTAPN